jgi:hypothetical protein
MQEKQKKKAKQHNYNGIKGCVTQRQIEIKGILVSVYHCKQRKVFPKVKTSMVKWATVCEQHNEKVFTDNINLARDLMKTSEEWCFGCFKEKAKNSKYLISIPVLNHISYYCYQELTPVFLDDKVIGNCYIHKVHNEETEKWHTYGQLNVSEIPEDYYLHVNFSGSVSQLYLSHIFFDKEGLPKDAGRSITLKDCLYKN